MTQEYAPIDFMEGQFVVLDGFQRIPRRRVSKVIRGCGAPMGSLTSKKSAPVRFLVGDGFHDMERSGDFAVEVDGVVLGHVRDVEECVDLTGARVFGEDEIIASTGIGLPANARMSMLRGALQGEPTRAGWNHAVAVLEAWPDAQGVEDAIRYAADLTAALLDSGQLEACFARHYVRFTFGRLEDTTLDGCALESLRGQLAAGATLPEVFKSIALRPEFHQRVMTDLEGETP